jgi:tetratricopeptide (TPR) repeat protein
LCEKLRLDPQSMPEDFPGEDACRLSVKAEAAEPAGILPAFTYSSQRATALAIVAVAYANAGRLADAVELAEAIGDGKPRVFAWHAIAVAQTKAGLTAESIASFDLATRAALSFTPHDELLAKIAISQAEAGQIDEALRVTGLIGGTQATAGYLSTVNGANTDYERRSALRAIAKAQARAGRIAEATQNAHALVMSGYIVPPGLGVVAEALAEAGRIDEAIKAAAIEDNPYWRAELLGRIARARAAAGKIDDAKRVAQHVAEDRYRADALASVAAAQSKAGLNVDAMATFRDALRIARSLRHKNVAAELLMEIAARLPE